MKITRKQEINIRENVNKYSLIGFWLSVYGLIFCILAMLPIIESVIILATTFIIALVVVVVLWASGAINFTKDEDDDCVDTFLNTSRNIDYGRNVLLDSRKEFENLSSAIVDYAELIAYRRNTAFMVVKNEINGKVGAFTPNGYDLLVEEDNDRITRIPDYEEMEKYGGLLFENEADYISWNRISTMASYNVVGYEKDGYVIVVKYMTNNVRNAYSYADFHSLIMEDYNVRQRLENDHAAH